MVEIGIIAETIKYGPAVLLIVGGLLEWYVWGPTYKRVVKERDQLLELALRAVTIAEKKK